MVSRIEERIANQRLGEKDSLLTLSWSQSAIPTLVRALFTITTLPLPLVGPRGGAGVVGQILGQLVLQLLVKPLQRPGHTK